ncbi:hypothetical protein [Rhodococcus sp. UFZ-B548]|uniref:hypothetical protein n=1 Tax=Rhodococcus sp. UFZ-B548 TaxID=2742212 RepID=UPI0015F7243F|nr:hypothetical protein [Rhodococcus sp. UFZ-B548]
MWRKIILAVVVALFAMLGLALPAAAQPTAVPNTDPAPGVQNATQSGKELPQGFPNDLKKFVAGTEEFKSASWFTGVCKDKGGDMGQYSTQVLHNENRLMYWTAKESERIALWASQVMISKNPVLIEALAAAGGVGTQMSGVDMGVEANQKAALSITDESILKGVYPDTYPLNESADMYPPSPTCADDLARWTTKTTTTWGFEWSPAPDAASLAAMKKQPNADKVPDAAWTDACSGGNVPSVLCMHAMFVNCERATPGEDMFACTEWNTRIGKLFGGTMNWIDQNTSFSDRLGTALESTMKATPAYIGGKYIVDSYTWAWDTFGAPIGDLVDFVKDPSDVIDSWANKLKSSAISTTNSVLTGLAGIGEFDPARAEFIAVYAVSTGIGLLVLVLMTILAIYKSSDGGMTGEELAKSLFGYMPAGIMLMMFAPAIAQLLISLMHEMSLALVEWIGTSTDEVIGNISSVLGSLTDSTLVGGSIAAIVGFGLMFLGAMAMFFGFLMHAAALPILAVVCGIAFGMWVHPTWRKKALRPVMMFLGVVLSKPLMFLILAAVFAVINIAAKGSIADDGKLESLGQLSLVAVCFVIIGLAPFSMLKYSPILPTSADSADFGGGGSQAGQTIGSGAQMFQQRAGGGSGGAGSHNSDAAGSPGRQVEGGPVRGAAGHHGASSSADESSASSTHAAASGGHNGASHQGGSAAKSAGKSGGAESKLMAAAGSTVGLAAGAAVVAAPIALAAAGAAMNKAGSAAQSAPEHADGDN